LRSEGDGDGGRELYAVHPAIRIVGSQPRARKLVEDAIRPRPDVSGAIRNLDPGLETDGYFRIGVGFPFATLLLLCILTLSLEGLAQMKTAIDTILVR
jgi:hypothetical protein